MKKEIVYIKSIAELHQMLGLPKPKHPQVSVFRHRDMNLPKGAISNMYFSMDFYMISLKDSISGNLYYGRERYDFQEGTMIFIAPNQVFLSDTNLEEAREDWMMVFDGDFIRSSELGKSIHSYHFFSYNVNEALHLSDDEKKTITNLVSFIEEEYKHPIDKHTKEILLTNLESMLNYCQRYYERQFVTRSSYTKDYIIRFEQFLKDYFENEVTEKGILTVEQCGKAMNMSAHYLSDILKADTGKSTKEHIDLLLVSKAKILLKNTENTISEIAYDLGFNYPSHFTKLFKTKTGLSPSEFRNNLSPYKTSS